MFNYNGNQNDLNPANNNCCGGFALTAVLDSMNLVNNLPALPAAHQFGIIGFNNNTPDNQEGLRAYYDVQNVQNAYGGVQNAFLINPATLVNGTRRSLPSGIVAAAINAGVPAGNITVNYGHAQLVASGFPAPLIAAEVASLTGLIGAASVNNVPGGQYDAPIAPNQYQLVLGLNGGHWWAGDQDGYYNPATGANENGIQGFSGLWIELH